MMRLTVWVMVAVLLGSFVTIAAAQDEPQVGSTRFADEALAIGLIVRDLDASRHFYVDLIGMVETGGFGIDSTFGRRSGLSGGVPFEVAIVQPRAGAGATQLKLVSFANTPEPHEGTGPGVQARTGMQYMTLYVEDAEAVAKRLREAGVRFEGETPMALGDGRTFILVRDPDGVYVEVIGASG